jgi:hypothetical protein
MMGTSRLAHLGVSGPFSSLGPVSSHGKSIELIVYFINKIFVCECTALLCAFFSTQKFTNDKYE